MAIDETLVVVGVDPRIGRDTFAGLLRENESPAGDDAEAGYDAIVAQGVDPLFALAIFHQESQFGTDGICFTEKTFSPGNTRSSRTGVGEVFETTDLGRFVRYPNWTEGWRDLAFRLVDTKFEYHKQGARTIGKIIPIWAPVSDVNTGSVGPNDPKNYIRRVIANMIDWQDDVIVDDRPDRPRDEIVFGRVPHPPFEDRLILDSETRAYNTNLGQRNPVGTCVHRLDGGMVGTDGWFRLMPRGGEAECDLMADTNDSRRFNFGGCLGLTDYAIGGQIENDLENGKDGVIFRWNDPTGEEHPGVSANRSPWANGRTNGLEANGRIFFDTLGERAVNRDLVSIELSGFANGRSDGIAESGVTDKQLESLSQLVAYWHDQARVPWHQFPFNPNVGIVTQLQHWEFTGDKDCPFPIVKGLTERYRARAKEIMRQFQTGGGGDTSGNGGGQPDGGGTTPVREEQTTPRRFVRPSPPPAFDGTDKQIRDVLFHADRRTVECAVKALSCRKWADPKSAETRRPLSRGETFESLYWINGVNVLGERRWWVTTTGTRIWVGGTVEEPD